MNPPSKSASPANDDVDEAEKWSDTWNGALTVDDAVLMNPASVERPPTVKVEVALTAPPTVSTSFTNAAPWTERSTPGVVVPMPTLPPVKAKRELPSTAIDDDDVSTSETWNGAETVELADEMNPESKVESPKMESVPVAVNELPTKPS